MLYRTNEDGTSNADDVRRFDAIGGEDGAEVIPFGEGYVLLDDLLCYRAREGIFWRGDRDS
jgi:hypothetical protein